MNVIICDDERIYLNSVASSIEQWATQNGCPSLTIKTFTSSEDMLDAWEHGMIIDLLFIDIEIPGEMNGLKAAQIIFHENEHIPIVFITNYSEYACEGYLVNALRYLRKPILQSQINDCMNIVWRRWLLQQHEKITLTTGSSAIVLPVSHIILAESLKHSVVITTSERQQPYQFQIGIDALYKKLPDEMFVKCHRCYIVNLMYVRQFNSKQIVMADRQIIPIGRSNSDNFVKAFRKYYQGGDDK